jgi:glucoamylase
MARRAAQFSPAGHSPDAPLADWMERQRKLSAAAMLDCISAERLVRRRTAFGQVIRPAAGSVVASTAFGAYDPDPDYFFHWLRDSAIVIDALRTLIEDGADAPGLARRAGDFVRFSLALSSLDGRALDAAAIESAAQPAFRQYLRSAEELRAAFGARLAGETRFNPDGSLDVLKWARPQHDGPALRALAVMRLWRLGAFDEARLRKAARRLIERDLAFTQRCWARPSFDIWEEEIGHHYYTRLVQSAALAEGAAWIDQAGEVAPADRAAAWRAAARKIDGRLDEHWDGAIYRSRVGPKANEEKALDIAVILAVIHAGRAHGAHSPLDPKAQATLVRLEALFAAEYPINQARPPGHGVAMGRYRGDHYYSGGAYYFATLGAAQFCYRLAAALPPDDAAAALARGDGFVATVRAYTPASGQLSEQFDQASGRQTSAKSLAWSHAALITAVAARRAAERASKGGAGALTTRQAAP